MNTLVLGTFDGVHRGHATLLVRAKETGGRVTVCTFDFPPAMTFDPTVRALTLPEEKEKKLKKLGADSVFSRPFDNTVAATEAEEYLRRLAEKFAPDYVVAGFDHTFGARAAGNGKTLIALGKTLGFKPLIVPPLALDGAVVSSTAIRALISQGEVHRVAPLLGERYTVSGETVHGRALGSRALLPTVNTYAAKEKLLPKTGVYATLVHAGGKAYRAMTNIGCCPTVGDGNALTVESHLLGFAGDLYGKKLTVEFVRRLRDEQKFASFDDLRAQLSLDAEMAEAILAAEAAGRPAPQ